jgi:hypothetical protein
MVLVAQIMNSFIEWFADAIAIRQIAQIRQQDNGLVVVVWAFGGDQAFDLLPGFVLPGG